MKYSRQRPRPQCPLPCLRLRPRRSQRPNLLQNRLRSLRPNPRHTAGEDYPLAAKSLRTHEGGRYAEEAKLNDDPALFKAVVDLTNQAVFVYTADETHEYTTLVREMICSSGIEETSRSRAERLQWAMNYKLLRVFCAVQLLCPVLEPDTRQDIFPLRAVFRAG